MVPNRIFADFKLRWIRKVVNHPITGHISQAKQDLSLGWLALSLDSEPVMSALAAYLGNVCACCVVKMASSTKSDSRGIAYKASISDISIESVQIAIFAARGSMWTLLDASRGVCASWSTG